MEDKTLKSKSVKNNQSVEKVLQIIEVMAENRGSMRLQDLSAKLGLPASTVLRFLNTLVMNNYVTQDTETLKYLLTMKICHIGSLVSSQLSIRDVVRPYLLKLSEKCEESACLAIEQDMMVVYIDVVDGPDNMLRTMQRIGRSAPMHSTGVGKILMLNYDFKKLDALIEEKGLPELTHNTITTKDALIAELEKIKLREYAFDDEECEIGAKCIAAPIKDYTEKIVASISISGPLSRMTMEKIELIKNHLKEASFNISEKLGYSSKDKS